MNDSSGNDAKSDSPAREAAQSHVPALEFAEALGSALINIDLYGMQHRIALDTIEDSFHKLTAALAAGKRIDIALSKDDILCLNGMPIESASTRILALSRRLKAVRISSFAIKQGMDAEEFVKIVTYLSRPTLAPEQGLADETLPHLVATRTVVMQVAEGDEAPAASPATNDSQGSGDGTSALNVQQILAFLKGNASPDDPEVRNQLAGAATDAGKLAELIMEATAVRQAAQSGGSAESLGELVVGCLRRTFDALNEEPSFKTQKGKKDLKRTLAVLEQSVLERLREFAKEGYDMAAPQVIDEIESMHEDIEIDSLVAQYVKSQRAASEKEKKLLRFMSRKGHEGVEASGLRDKLQADGLGSDDWHKLVVKSETGSCPGSGAPSPAGAEGTLVMLLAELTRVVEKASSDDQVSTALTKIGRGVEESLQRTSRKIDDVAAARDGRPPRDATAMRDLVGFIREIIQELCQPVTVINTTVDLLSQDRLGDLTRSQKQALNLAVEAGKRLRVLMDKLVDVIGVPDTLLPDSNTIERIYSGTNSR